MLSTIKFKVLPKIFPGLLEGKHLFSDTTWVFQITSQSPFEEHKGDVRT